MNPVIQGTIENGTLRIGIGVNRLDAASCRDFNRQIAELWSDGIQSAEMDFHQVDFIDSSGVGALLGIYKRLPRQESAVRLTHVKAPVQSVIELLRLHRIFQIQN